VLGVRHVGAILPGRIEAVASVTDIAPSKPALLMMLAIVVVSIGWVILT
jgi:hypothetical protein